MSIALYRNPFVPSLMRDVFGDQGWTSNERSSWGPAADVYEKEGTLHFQFELPGLKKSDITVEYNEGILTVSGERVAGETGDDVRYFNRERHTGEFVRAFRIGNAYDPKTIGATFDEGILYVSISKREESKPMTIKVS